MFEHLAIALIGGASIHLHFCMIFCVCDIAGEHI